MTDKIQKLFNYRQLPLLIELSKIHNKKSFLSDLVDLQSAIYELDLYLESNWKTSEKQLKIKWKAIYRCLQKIGVPKRRLDEFCKQIYKYQQHELGLRKNKFPTELSLKYFYFYKSCDVKLMRKLIYFQSPSNKKFLKLADWSYFDLITEMNDDIDDVYEDMKSINDNRFLISILVKGKKFTNREFNSHLKRFKEESSNRFKLDNINSVQKSIAALTDKAALDTIKLLKKRVAEKKIDRLDSSILCQYIDFKK